MKDMLLHPATLAELDQLIAQAPHAVMLIGSEHAGKRHVAAAFAGQVLATPLDNHPHFMRISPIKNSLGIDQIRELQRFVKLKTTGSGNIRRAIIIENAHLMTVEAQNALLKLLEEPPEDTILIMTVRGDTSLKPTIYSRTQNVFIRPITRELAHEHTAGHHGAAEVDRAYMLSKGNAGLFLALLNDSEEHILVSAIADAKQFLSATTFERLVLIESLGKDKIRAELLLNALKRISEAALRAGGAKQSAQSMKRWHRVLGTTYEAEALLSTTANTKLVLTDAFLAL